MQGHTAAMRMMPMFPEVNPLPRAQCQLTAFERDTEIHRGQRRAHMRRHIIFTFGGVAKSVAWANQLTADAARAANI